ncbi:MAG: ribonuclease HII [Bacillota bacterium]|nr:ribonuclease HII [Bacillota bacterium]
MSYKELANYVNEIPEELLDNILSILQEDSRKNVQQLVKRLNKKKQDSLAEIDRVKGLYNFDKSFGNYRFVAGVDEVGRGPLAGPIVAAAVILDLDYISDEDLILGIKDSKQLASQKRNELAEIIKKKAVSYSISNIDSNDIDNKGIAFCNNESFKLALNGMNKIPDLVLSDGYPVKGINIKNEYVIKGDSKSASIACASILAKVYRDNLMLDYHNEFPNYGFDKNVGYGTKDHIDAINTYGVCKIHRMSFLKNIYKGI